MTLRVAHGRVGEVDRAQKHGDDLLPGDVAIGGEGRWGRTHGDASGCTDSCVVIRVVRVGVTTKTFTFTQNQLIAIRV